MGTSGAPGDRVGLTGQSGPDADPIARVLGSSYLLYEVLGQGATGEVWRGVYRPTEQPVAVKILRPGLATDHDLVARFLRERSILTALRDPHLVGVRDLVAEGDTLAIVMDLVDGTDLRRYLTERGTLAPALAATLMVQVLSGLQVGHDAGVVHRDIKPENILLDLADPDAPQARVSDFGIARLTQGPSLTHVKGTIGTPEYMPPELAEDGEATPASDLYAVGIMLYELVAGRSPFSGGSPLQVLRRQVDAVPVRPPGMPDGLWNVIDACLAKRPEARPASARQLSRRLEKLAGELAALGALPVAPEGSTMLKTPRPSAPPETAGPDGGASGARETFIPGGRPEPRRSRTPSLRRGAPGGRTKSAPTPSTPERAAPQRPGPDWAPPELRETFIPGGRPEARRSPGLAARWAALGIWRWGIAGGLALVTIVAAVITLRPASPRPEADVNLTRSFSLAVNGLTVRRTWTVDREGLRTVLEVTNDTANPATRLVDEVIPKSIAASVRDVVFDSPVPETVKDDPVVRYKVENLAPRATSTFTYRVASRAASREQVDRWAEDQARADREHTTLAKLAVLPPEATIPVRQVLELKLQGTMRDGTTTPLDATAASWSSSNPAVAVLFGKAVGLSAGTAVVTAKVGDVQGDTRIAVQALATAPAQP